MFPLSTTTPHCGKIPSDIPGVIWGVRFFSSRPHCTIDLAKIHQVPACIPGATSQGLPSLSKATYWLSSQHQWCHEWLLSFLPKSCTSECFFLLLTEVQYVLSAVLQFCSVQDDTSKLWVCFYCQEQSLFAFIDQGHICIKVNSNLWISWIFHWNRKHVYFLEFALRLSFLDDNSDM